MAKAKPAKKKSTSKKSTTSKKNTSKTASKKKVPAEKKKSKKKIVGDTPATRILSPNYTYRLALNEQISEIEKGLRLTSRNVPAGERFSTGLLVTDIIMGGGLVSGMYSVAGPEASAKSTLTFHQWKEALLSDIPYIVEYDAEGSVDPSYVGNIFGDELDLEECLSGVNPRSKYYPDSSLESFFKSQSRVLRRMPDKYYNEEAKTWMFAFPKRNKIANRMMDVAGFKPSKALTTETHFGVATECSQLQGIIFADSWPAFVTEDVDKDDPKGEARMALMASKFSLHLPYLVGKLKRKNVVLYGVNQLREKPGVIYGPTQYEPSGNALKFASGVRNRIGARVPPDGWVRHKKNGGVCVEPSAYVEGAVDEYQFKEIKNTKNKFSTPFLTGWLRVWSKDHNNEGRGFDVVFDCYEYLRTTKQIKGSRKKFSVEIGNLKGIKMDWYTFKCLILGEEYRNSKSVLDFAMKELGIKKKPGLRKACFNQVATGKYKKLIIAGSSTEYFDGDDDDDDE